MSTNKFVLTPFWKIRIYKLIVRGALTGGP